MVKSSASTSEKRSSSPCNQNNFARSLSATVRGSRKWEMAFEIAHTLVEIAPDNASSWLKQAECLRKMKDGGPKAAYDALLPVADRFSGNPTVAYSLACYSCQMGNLKEAYGWLDKAIN